MSYILYMYIHSTCTYMHTYIHTHIHTYIHICSYIHTSIHVGKNILVFNDGRTVKLTDFGSAIRMDALEVNNSLVGCTPNFSAPEVSNQHV